MANFSSKLFSVAAAAMVFAGIAAAQAPLGCTATTPQGASLVRAEGTTETVAEVSLTCSNATSASPGGNATFSVFIGPSNVPVTSRVISSSTNSTEALAIVTSVSPQGTSAGSWTSVVQGTVTPGSSSITFTNVVLPATPAGTTVYVTFAKIRINASVLATNAGGVPPSVTETVFSAGQVVQTQTQSTVAFVQKGLSNPTLNGALLSGATTGATNFVICQTITNNAAAFYVHLGENFSTAFKFGTVANAALGTEFSGNSEAAIAATVNSGIGTATFGTRVTVTLSNIPANVAVYLPTSVSDDVTAINSPGLPGVTVLRATSSATGALAPISPSTASGAPAGYLAATVSGGTATVIYEFAAGLTGVAPGVPTTGAQASSTVDSFSIPVVFRQTTANTIPATNSSVTALASLSPVGSTAFPNFAATTNTSLNGSKFNNCTTSLLFPFVTNASGFDTGMAISNTSADPFGTANQPGTCTLNFYGTGAPTAFTTTSVAAGSAYTNLASTVSPGFQGYMIAQCAFQYAHGFAFITDGFGGPGRGLSQGYLAGVIQDVNQTNGARQATDPSRQGSGLGEVLGH